MNFIQKLANLKNSIGWLPAIRLGIFKMCRRLLNLEGRDTYSQFGEDVVIESFFSGKGVGYYVDIGCNEPVNYSNTWKLYVKGWAGLAIDANEALIEKFGRVRPRDVSVFAVISDKESLVDFYSSNKSHLISGIGELNGGYWERTDANCQVIRLQSVRLDTLMKKYHSPQDIDFMSIDVEGHEMEVLDSMDLNLYRPRLIAVEMHDLVFEDLQNNKLYRRMVDARYRFHAYTPPTAFFERL